MTPRPVQQSAFAEYPDRNVGPVLGSVQTGTNADLIAKVAPLYLQGRVLDVTYGRGKWWDRFRPTDFTFHDLALDGVDFRELPHPDGAFDAVCFDPPYVPTGGEAKSERARDMRDAFGIDRRASAPRSRADVWDLFLHGLLEAARVVKPAGFILAKCSDYTESARFTLGHLDMFDAAKNAGLYCHDLIVHHTGSGPGGHNITEILRARRHHSYLMVFKPETARPGSAA